MKLETGSNPITLLGMHQRDRDRTCFHTWCGLYHSLLEVSPKQPLSREPKIGSLVCSQTWKQNLHGKWLQKESRKQCKCTNDLRLCKEKHQTNIPTKHSTYTYQCNTSTYRCLQEVSIILYRVRSVEKKNFVLLLFKRSRNLFVLMHLKHTHH